MEMRIMAVLDEVVTEVSEITTVVDSAIALIKGLHDALVAAGTDPVKLAEIRDNLNRKGNELAEAVAANTPAEPPTT